MSALILPLAFVNWSGGAVSKRENRVLAARPAISSAFKAPRDFIKQFDAWFADNVGFRKKIIRLYGKLNNISQGYYLDGAYIVLIGKRGHHFHVADGDTLRVYQGEHWLDETQAYELSSRLQEIKRCLDGRNIPFIVMVCADKESIYPEYYPDFVIRGPGPASLDVVVEYLNEHTEVDLFCIKERLLQAKEDYLVFPKTGNIYELRHYNETGAFLAYQELMKHIGAYFPKLAPFSIDDVNIEYQDNGSSSVSLRREVTYQRIEPRFFDDALEFENMDSGLPTLLLLCDSYADWFPNYLPQHFGRMIMHPWSGIEHFEEYLDLYKPDVIVFEVAERAITAFANAMTKYHPEPQ